MGENSKIEWCDHTFNPWLGCTPLSPACDFCYADGWAKRTGQAHLWKGDRRRTALSNWQQPYKWNRNAAAKGIRYRVFCASLADVFDNQVPEEWRVDLWQVIHDTPSLDWLLLTKRPQNIGDMLPRSSTWPWPNVWLGTTAENQAEADRRIPQLLATPAAVRFLSCEPLLGPISLDRWPVGSMFPAAMLGKVEGGFDWVIAGGESGPGARPMHPGWGRSLRDLCAAAGVPYFHKQNGEWLDFQEATCPGRVQLADGCAVDRLVCKCGFQGWYAGIVFIP